MNKTDAEILLRCHRTGREPDSRTQKALRMADGDAELGKLLRTQREFDDQIVNAIQQISPPEDLRARMGAHHERAGGQPRPLRAHFFTPAILAAVAGVLLIVGVIVFIVLESMANFPGREAVETMIETTGKMSGGEFEPVRTNTAELGDWLYMRHYEGFQPPAELAAASVVGARVFTQDGKRIAQYVVEQHEAVVFEFHTADFGVQLPPEDDWRILEKNAWVAALRQRGEHCLMIAFRGDEAAMRKFLASLSKP